MTDPTLWRANAIDLTLNYGAWEPDRHAEAIEGLLVAVTCALLDVAAAVRERAQEPQALARLADAAPTAEALALLLRAHQTDPTKENYP